ncbi:hypothetical protein RF11_09185 [Thelohanellus kitauei]|uniref:Uncharacterized protein n=1 Tax=Thelohanellus kitauei TaxID=669202 RepID=A0A0C2N4B9_THEKT|nr:hypothetical protein RF11_09185 [Thelohanellus kitauei]
MVCVVNCFKPPFSSFLFVAHAFLLPFAVSFYHYYHFQPVGQRVIYPFQKYDHPASNVPMDLGQNPGSFFIHHSIPFESTTMSMISFSPTKEGANGDDTGLNQSPSPSKYVPQPDAVIHPTFPGLDISGLLPLSASQAATSNVLHQPGQETIGSTVWMVPHSQGVYLHPSRHTPSPAQIIHIYQNFPQPPTADVITLQQHTSQPVGDVYNHINPYAAMNVGGDVNVSPAVSHASPIVNEYDFLVADAMKKAATAAAAHQRNILLRKEAHKVHNQSVNFQEQAIAAINLMKAYPNGPKGKSKKD